jgi:hypothetical protein
VGTRWFGRESHETEGAVEAVRIGTVRPQPEAGKASHCRPHDHTDKLRADPLPSMLDGDIKVTDTPHRRIVQVGALIQPADADDKSVVGGDEDGFTWLVETVPTRLPFILEAGERLEAGRGRLRHQGLEPIDRHTIDAFDRDHALTCPCGSRIPRSTLSTKVSILSGSHVMIGL